MAIFLSIVAVSFATIGAIILCLSIPAESTLGIILGTFTLLGALQILGLAAILDHLRRANKELRSLIQRELAQRLQELHDRQDKDSG